MNRIKLASYAFLIYIPLFALWIIALPIIYWGLGLERLGNDLIGQNFYEIYVNPPIEGRALYGGLSAIPVVLLRLVALWFLWKMFYNFIRGKILISDTVHHLKQYAKYSCLAVVVFFFLSGIRRWALGEFDDLLVFARFQLNPHETAILFSSAIIYVASKIIEEGNKYKAETESYV